MPDRITLQLEKSLAAAHQATSRAYNLACQDARYGLQDDLAMIALELARLLEETLKGASHQRVSRI